MNNTPKPLPSTNLWLESDSPESYGHISVRVDREVYQYFKFLCPRSGGISTITRYMFHALYNECLKQSITPSYEHHTQLSAILDRLSFAGRPGEPTPVPHANSDNLNDKGGTRGKRKKVA